MVGGVLTFLRNRLDSYLRAELQASPDEPAADKVVFVQGDKMDPLSFQEGAVSELVVKVEEERLLRPAEPYTRVLPDGSRVNAQPDLRLVLYVLFVARFKQYDLAWDHLGKVLEYLQSNPIFERSSSPELPPGIEKLSLEFMTQSFAEQNDVWGALRTTAHPALLYRLRLVVLRDVKPVAVRQITTSAIQVKRLS